MWIVVYITQNRETAVTVKNLLQDGGLHVKMRSIGLRENAQYGCYEVLLPESEIDAGHNIIINNIV